MRGGLCRATGEYNQSWRTDEVVQESQDTQTSSNSLQIAWKSLIGAFTKAHCTRSTLEAEGMVDTTGLWDSSMLRTNLRPEMKGEWSSWTNVCQATKPTKVCARSRSSDKRSAQWLPLTFSRLYWFKKVWSKSNNWHVSNTSYRRKT